MRWDAEIDPVEAAPSANPAGICAIIVFADLTAAFARLYTDKVSGCSTGVTVCYTS